MTRLIDVMAGLLPVACYATIRVYRMLRKEEKAHDKTIKNYDRLAAMYDRAIDGVLHHGDEL